ncbi:Septum formation [Promicromonospora thailandica]|uniref:Septum formation n=1 Tax=Promicromonospora thailandica TaxID=765201 RepID=A0A9X2G374_9MICO|nr:Septum formation [Promicromonospora thailandica]
MPLHRGWVVASMILFWPLAIAAVLAANRAAAALGAGDTPTAEREARAARGHARLGVLIGGVWTGLALTFDIALVVLGVQHGPAVLEWLGRPTPPAQSAETSTAAPAYRSAAAPERDPIAVDPLRLQVGDCFMVPSGDGFVGDVDVIPCSRPHDGLVVSVTEHAYDEFPGTAALDDGVWYDCESRYRAYTGRPLGEVAPLWVLHPDAEDWRTGERSSVCYIEALYPEEGEFSEHPQVLLPRPTS